MLEALLRIIRKYRFSLLSPFSLHEHRDQHDHHDHAEAEQNEIGGPVVLALFLFAIVITVIYFLS